MPTAPQSLRARKSGWPAAPSRPAPVVDYPDRGVPPMTSIHLKAILNAVSSLQNHYAHRDDVYVGGELSMYWQEGDNERWVQPDVFVAFGPSKGERQVWLSWEEGKFADFVLEVASRGTHRRDLTVKRAIYEGRGVAEYWQHDPTGKYLPPRLLGQRLNNAGTYEPIRLETKPDGTRCGESKVLALHLCLDSEGCLRLYDPAAGEFLHTPKELAAASAEKDRVIAEERQRHAQERQRHAQERQRHAQERQRHAEERRALLAEIEALKGRQPSP